MVVYGVVNVGFIRDKEVDTKSLFARTIDKGH